MEKRKLKNREDLTILGIYCNVITVAEILAYDSRTRVKRYQ